MLQSSWPTQPQVLKKLGLNLSFSNDSQGMDSLNPTQRFNLNQATLTKRGWWGLSKCSQGSHKCSECNGISTHEWVKSWGINTTLSKTSRCPCLCQTDPSDRSLLKTSRWRLRLVPWIGQTGLTLKSAVLALSPTNLSMDCFEHLWYCLNLLMLHLSW